MTEGLTPERVAELEQLERVVRHFNLRLPSGPITEPGFKRSTLVEEPGRLELQVEFEAGRTPLVELFACEFAGFFRLHGGINYVFLTVETEELGPMALSLRRELGRSPEHLHQEAIKEVERLRGALRAITKIKLPKTLAATREALFKANEIASEALAEDGL